MIQLDEYKNQSANLSSMLKEAGQSLGIESMQEELKTLKEQMEQEGFWDDIESANKVTRKIRPLEQSIKEYESLTSALEDFDTLLM
ncbi:MAG: PCRF domain-containing protein, partial [Clostridia bacterium]|nr:PCRF domain-containing protein [Clostridia bacterium]